MTANIIARIANNVTRIASCNAINNNAVSFAKEHTTMNAFKSIVTRTAKTLGALALLSLATAAVKADVIVDDWVPPSHNTTVSVPLGTTALQLKLDNANNYSVSGVKASVTLWLGFNLFGKEVPISGTQSTVTTSPINMTPNQDTWVNITIPHNAPNGASYYGNTVYATITVGSNSFTISFLDVAPSASLEVASVTNLGNSSGADVFSITFLNTGYATSAAVTLTVSTWQSSGSDDPFGTVDAQSVAVPALGHNNSYTVTLTSQPTQGYDIYGLIQNGNVTLQTFSF